MRASADQIDEIVSGCYVYGIVADPCDPPPRDPIGRGVDPDNPVYCVAHGDIRAVVSDASLGEFGEEALDTNLRDVDWLAAKARAHHDVLQMLSTARTVVPMRFCTIYSSGCRVQEMLSEHYDDFVGALARLEGKQEWGVKVYCMPEVLRGQAGQLSDIVKSLNSELADKSDAASYFLKKKIDNTVLAEEERITDEVVQDSHDCLSMRSWEALAGSVQGREVTRREEDMVLNGAYLVSRECVEAFKAELDDLRKKYGGLGFSYEISGPWPPYSFAGSAFGKGSVDEPVCA